MQIRISNWLTLCVHHTSKLGLLLFSLNRNFLPDFFLDLLEGLQKELLNLRPLIEHDLRQSSYIFKLFGFHSEILSQSGDVFSLLFDNLLMLEFQKFLFFFEIIDDLLKRVLQDFDLILQNFDFLLLLKTSIFVLISGLLLDQNIPLLIFRFRVKFCLFSLVVIKSIPLRHSLLR